MGLRRILLVQSEDTLYSELSIVLKFLECDVVMRRLDALEEETDVHRRGQGCRAGGFEDGGAL